MALTLPSWLRRRPNQQELAAARQAGRQELAEEIQRYSASLPNSAAMLGAPASIPHGKAPYPIYAYDAPITFSVPQPPQRRPKVAVSNETLRKIGDTWDILRACILQLQREVTSVPLEIVPRDGQKLTAAGEARIAEAKHFFSVPGGLGGVGERRTHFERKVIEDVAVIGAAALYFQPTRAGRPYQVLPIDASTIRPKVDAYGWPGPGQAAYQQWIYSALIAEYTREEIRYDGIYPLSYSPYFKSPIEYLLLVGDAFLRADDWNRQWVTDGTTVSDIIALPEAWDLRQIQDFAFWWGEKNRGDSAERQKLKFVPSGSQRVGSPSRKDQDFEAWQLGLLRRCCAIFGVMPASIGFAGEQYKVTQDASMDATSDYGVGVFFEYFKAIYDDILERLGYEDLETQRVRAQEEASKERAERNSKLVLSAIKTPNEARADEGLDPIDGGDTLFVPTANQPLELALEPPQPPAPGGVPPAEEDTAARLALSQWERKALNRLRAGKSAGCDFATEALPVERVEQLRAGLDECASAAAVRELFRGAEE